LLLVVADSTRVFLTERGVAWYAGHRVEIRTLATIELCALTVNPVAPQSHSLDSAVLLAGLREAIAGVPVYDVLAPDYGA
jgi:hypothetical protein